MDKYDGKYYIINGKPYTEKTAMIYLKTIKYTEQEAKEYLALLRMQ